jgi:hypothetical protein
MINQSRLSAANNIPASRSAQDERRSSENMFSPVGGPQDGSEQTSALNGLQPLNNGAAAGGGNSFSQLLELSKMDKPEVQPTKKERTDKQTVNEPKAEKETEKKDKTETAVQRKTVKTKEKKVQSEDTELALTQLLTAQQTPAKANGQEQQNLKPQEQQVLKPQEQQSLKPIEQQKMKNRSSADPLQFQDLRDQVNSSESAFNLNSNLNGKDTDTKELGALQNSKPDQSQSLTDIMKALNSKMDTLSALPQKGKDEVFVQPKSDQFADLSAKFDDVKFEFTPNTEASQAGAKVLSGMNTNDLQNTELMKRMAELEWSQNDLAIRDILSQQAIQEQALEKMTVDRLDQLAALKNGQLDRLQMQDLQSARMFKEMMLQDAQAAAQSQWLSYRDLPADQRIMLESMNAGNAQQGFASGSASQNQQGGSAVNGRLANPTDSSPNMILTRDAVTEVHSLPSMAQDHSGNTNGGQNSSSRSLPQNNETSAVGSAGSVRDAQSKTNGGAFDVAEKADAKARESERTREMARAAALRTQSIASELAAKGGGTAKVQIKDRQLGVVELRISMSDNNKVNVELIANNERIKNELEKQSEDLKSGLEKHKVVLEGVRFATDTKLGDSSSQNSSQSDSSRANQQQQQQQNFSSFSQNSSGSQQQNFSGGERFFEGPRLPLSGQNASPDNARKNYSGKNDAQTNVQRNANGSLKVTA